MDRAVCGDPPHLPGQVRRHSHKQRVAGPAQCVGAGLPLVGIDEGRCHWGREGFVGAGGQPKWCGRRRGSGTLAAGTPGQP